MSKRIPARRLSQSVANALYATPAVALLALGLSTPAFAADEPTPQDTSESTAQDAKTLDTVSVISTGTRKSNMAVTDSPAPIQLVSAETLSQSGAPDLQNAIADQVPSFNVRQIGTDMASQTLTAALRSLSANHTLILVNGKRLHTTSNVNPNNGEAAADLSFIPQAAIDHIEVLTDGAAALYGSDAIAGVINIILKKNKGNEADVSYGAYEDGGGNDPKISADIAFGDSKNYFNLSAESEDRQSVFRFSPSAYGNCEANYADCLAVNPSMAAYVDTLDPNHAATGYKSFPYLNTYPNPPAVKRQIMYINAGLALGDNWSFYAFGGFGQKQAESLENYRMPEQSGASPSGTYLYPYGFQPSEASKERDFQLTVGVTGNLAGWTVDASTAYGKDIMDVYTLNSMNFTLWDDYGYSPTDFYDGAFYASQWTTDVSATRDFDVGLSAPLTLNFGVEYREDGYGIEAGDPYSYYGVGASSFPGYNPDTNTGNYTRHNEALYADVVFNPIEHWLVDVAGRYENYSDFGSKTIGKLTTRFDFTDSFAVRATASTGFRAPTLAEEYYSAVQVGPTSASPTLRANDAAAAALTGESGLKPETSVNYSLGFVFNPLPSLSSTLDFYQITIKNRIASKSFTYSTSVDGAACAADPITGDALDDCSDYNAALGAALVSAGYLGSNDPTASGGSLDSTARANISVTVLTNAYTTRSRGVDWVTNWNQSFDWGSIDWLLSANYNTIKVLSVRDAPAALGGGALFDTAEVINMEKNNPKFRVNIGPTFNIGKFNIALHEMIYGSQYYWTSSYDEWGTDLSTISSVWSQLDTATFDGANYYKMKLKAMAVTNIDVTFKPDEHWSFSVGADNVFNKYPTKNPYAAYEYEVTHYDNQWDMLSEYQINSNSPVGWFGGYYYAKLKYQW
ncbi:MAG: TonB-dependent receptor [Myxococcales bacterium]